MAQPSDVQCRQAAWEQTIKGPLSSPYFYIFITLTALGPRSPSSISNCTLWPSANVLNPSLLIEEKWTKTSAPLSCWIKPKPFDSLNHLTFPSKAITARSSFFPVPRNCSITRQGFVIRNIYHVSNPKVKKKRRLEPSNHPTP